MHGADQAIRSSHGCTAAQIGTEGVQKVFQGIFLITVLVYLQGYPIRLGKGKSAKEQ